MSSNRAQLNALIQSGRVPEASVEQAVDAAGLYPEGADWRRFIDQTLVWLAGLAFAFAVLFFVAYNWTAWGRLARFALVEAALVLCLVAYWFVAARPILAQAALVTTSLMLGVLLALFGQVYQTGADPWQLFFNWALLILPWTLLACLPALWVLWVALLNLAIALYFDTFGPPFFWVGEGARQLLWLLFAFNTVVLALWELAARYWSWLAVDWARRLIALGVGVPVTQAALWIVLDSYGGGEVGRLLVYGLWLLAWFGVYRWVRPDLFMLAGGCLSAILVLLSWLAEPLVENLEALGFLLLAFLLIGSGAAAAQWLKRVHRELQS